MKKKMGGGMKKRERYGNRYSLLKIPSKGWENHQESPPKSVVKDWDGIECWGKKLSTGGVRRRSKRQGKVSELP